MAFNWNSSSSSQGYGQWQGQGQGGHGQQFSYQNQMNMGASYGQNSVFPPNKFSGNPQQLNAQFQMGGAFQHQHQHQQVHQGVHVPNGPVHSQGNTVSHHMVNQAPVQNNFQSQQFQQQLRFQQQQKFQQQQFHQGPPQQQQFQHQQQQQFQLQQQQQFQQQQQQQQLAPSNTKAQEDGKRQQFEEQQRKLKEMSFLGTRARSASGKNLIEDMMSKANSSLTTFKSGPKAANKPTSVFGKQENTLPQTDIEDDFSTFQSAGFHPQVAVTQQQQLKMPQHFPQASTTQSSQSQLSVQLQSQADKQNQSGDLQNVQQHQQNSALVQRGQGQMQATQNISEHFAGNPSSGGGSIDMKQQTIPPGMPYSSASSRNSIVNQYTSCGKEPPSDDYGEFQQGVVEPSPPRSPPFGNQILQQNFSQLTGGAAFFQQNISSNPQTTVFTSTSSFGVQQEPSSGLPALGGLKSGAEAVIHRQQPSHPGMHGNNQTLSYDIIPGAHAPSQAQSLHQIDDTLISNPLPPEEEQKELTEVDYYGCELPDWCHDHVSLPPIYMKVLKKSQDKDGYINIHKLHPILLASNLAKEKLAEMWEIANKKTPGTLTEEELFLILAMVALAQAGWNKLSLRKLASCRAPPIPELPDYLFLDKEGGSVFGEESRSFTSQEDIVSALPVDPNDRYSAFRVLDRQRSESIDDGSIGAERKLSMLSTGSADSSSFVPNRGNVAATIVATNEKEDDDWGSFATFPARNTDTAPAANRQPAFSATNVSDVDTGILQPIVSANVETPVVPNFPPLNANSAVMTHPSVSISSHQAVVGNAQTADNIESKATPNANILQMAVFSAPDSQTEKLSTGEARSLDDYDDFSAFHSVNTSQFGSGELKPDLTEQVPVQPTEMTVTASLRHNMNVLASLPHSTASKPSSVGGAPVKSVAVSDDFDNFASFSNVIESNLEGEKSQQPAFAFANFEEQSPSVPTMLPSQILNNSTVPPSSVSVSLAQSGQITDGDTSNLDDFSNFASFQNAGSSNFYNSQPFQKERYSGLVAQGVTSVSTSALDRSDDKALGDLTSFQPACHSASAPALSEPVTNQATPMKELWSSASIAPAQASFLASNSNSQISQLQSGITNLHLVPGVTKSGPVVPLMACVDTKPPDDFGDFSTAFPTGESNVKKPRETIKSDQELVVENINTSNVENDKHVTLDWKNGLPQNSAEQTFRHSIDQQKQNSDFGKYSGATPFNGVHTSQMGVSGNIHINGFSHSNGPFGNSLDLHDPYSAFKEGDQEAEKHATEWKRCLQSAIDTFSTAVSTIKRHNISEQAKMEVLNSTKGKEHFNGLKEIYAVCCRITTTISNSALSKSDNELQRLLSQIKELWGEIRKFMITSPSFVIPDILDLNACRPAEGEDDANMCGVCLLSIKRDSESAKSWQLITSSLTYGGKAYHSTCANFWCNKVKSVLPALPPISSGLL